MATKDLLAVKSISKILHVKMNTTYLSTRVMNIELTYATCRKHSQHFTYTVINCMVHCELIHMYIHSKQKGEPDEYIYLFTPTLHK